MALDLYRPPEFQLPDFTASRSAQAPWQRYLASLGGGGGLRPEPGSDEDVLQRAQSRMDSREALGVATGAPGPASGEAPRGLLTTLGEYLDRPKSATVGALSGLLGMPMHDDLGDSNPLDVAARRAWRGFTTEQRYGFGDMPWLNVDPDASLTEKIIKYPAAFIGDVALDPLTYVSLGGSVVGKKIAGEAVHNIVKQKAPEVLGKKGLVKWSERSTAIAGPRVAGQQAVRQADEATLAATQRAAKEAAEQAKVPPSTWHGTQEEWLQGLGASNFGGAAAEAFQSGGATGLRRFLVSELGEDAGSRLFANLPRDVQGGLRIRLPFSRDPVTHTAKAIGVGGGGRALSSVGLGDAAVNVHRMRNRIRARGVGRKVADKLSGADGELYGQMVEDLLGASADDIAGVQYAHYMAAKGARQAAERAASGLHRTTVDAYGRAEYLVRNAPDVDEATRARDALFNSPEQVAALRASGVATEDGLTWSGGLLATMTESERAGATAAMLIHDQLAHTFRELRNAGVSINEINEYIPRIMAESESLARQVQKPVRGSRRQHGGVGGYQQTKTRQQYIRATVGADGEPTLEFRWMTPEEANAAAGREVFETDPMVILARYGDSARRLLTRTKYANALHEAGVVARGGTEYKRIMSGVPMREAGLMFDDSAAGHVRWLENAVADAQAQADEAAGRATAARQKVGEAEGVVASARRSAQVGSREDPPPMRYAEDAQGNIVERASDDIVVQADGSITIDSKYVGDAGRRGLTTSDADDERLLHALEAARSEFAEADNVYTKMHAQIEVERISWLRQRLREQRGQQVERQSNVETGWFDWGPEHAVAGPGPPGPEVRHVDQAGSRGHEVIYRNADGEPVGNMFIYLDEQGVPYSLDVVVRHDSRGQGIARRMGEAAMEAGVDVETALRRNVDFTEAGAAATNRVLRAQAASDEAAARLKGATAQERLETASRLLDEATSTADAAAARQAATQARLDRLNADLEEVLLSREKLARHIEQVMSLDDVEAQFEQIDVLMDALVDFYGGMHARLGAQIDQVNKADREVLQAAQAMTRQRLEATRKALRSAKSGREVVDPIAREMREAGLEPLGAHVRGMPQTPDAVLPPELDLTYAPQMVRMAAEKIYRASKPGDGDLMRFIDGVYRPYFTWFKFSATVGRGPGYHFRNTIGGIWNNWLRDVSVNDHRLSARLNMARARAWNQALDEISADQARLLGKPVEEIRKNLPRPPVVARAERILQSELDNVMVTSDVSLYKLHQMSLQEEIGWRDSRVFEGVHGTLKRQDDAESIRFWQAYHRSYDEVVDPPVNLFSKTRDPEELRLFHQIFNKSVDWWWSDVSKNWAMKSEDFIRHAAFIRGVREYGAADGGKTAALLSRALHFDYQDLSDFEAVWMRGTFIPFYIWTRHNVPLQFRALFKEPGKMHRLLMFQDHMREAFEDEEVDVVPEWMQEKLGFVSRFRNRAGHPIVMGVETPAYDLNRFIKVGRPSETFRSLSRNLVGQVSPVFKLPAEVGLGYDSFTGAPFNPRGVEAPFWWRALPFLPTRTDADGKVRASHAGTKVVSDLAPWLGQAGRLFPTTQAGQERLLTSWLATLTAAPVSTLSPGQHAGELRARSDRVTRAVDWGVPLAVREEAERLLELGYPPEVVAEILARQ